MHIHIGRDDVLATLEIREDKRDKTRERTEEEAMVLK